MSFVQLKQFRTTNVIQKKQRINLIVQYSMSSFFVFYKDKTFQHIDRKSKTILMEKQLQFLPSSYLSSDRPERMVLLGLNDMNNFCCGLIEVQNGCNVEVRILSDKKPEKTTKYHLYESSNLQQSNLFIIMVLKNCENGIAVAIYDYQKNLWGEQMIALSSKFLQYLLINTSVNDQQYQEKQEVLCHTFSLVSLGDRYESINYSKIKFVYEQKSDKSCTLKLKFIITRQVKLKQHFVFLGGLQSNHNSMILVGNSKKQSNSSNEFSQLPAYLVMNTEMLDNNELQQLNIKQVSFNKGENEIFEVRSCLGRLQGNLLLAISLPLKKFAIARFSLNNQELMVELQQCKAHKFELSIQKDCLFNYDLQCELFFQKLKNAPSKITFNLVKIQGKRYQYNKMLRSVFKGLNPYFIGQITSLF